MNRSRALIGVVADDLTSAADGAAPFVARGLTARVGIGRRVPADSDVCSVDIGSRGQPPRIAAQRTETAARALADARILYKTVDSTLRGNIGVEVEAAFRVGRRKRVVFAPAYPEGGRTTRAGKQFVHGQALSDTVYARDPLHPLRSDDLAASLGVLGNHAARVSRDAITSVGWIQSDILVVDAEQQSELDLLVACMPQPEACLWVGSPGLALALAARFAKAATPGTRPLALKAKRVLVVVGSANPTSREQLEYIAHQGTLVIEMNQVPPADARLIVTATPRARNHDVSKLTASFAEHVARLLVAGAFDAIVVTGGETADRGLRAVGVSEFDLLGELAPGFPVGRTNASVPLIVALKAGGFGEPDTLWSAAQELLAETGVAA